MRILHNLAGGFRPSLIAVQVLLIAIALSTGLVSTTVAQVQSDDATLSALTLSDVDIGTFASGTTTYTATVASSVTETTVTPTTNHSGASYVVKLGGVTEDDGEVSLGVGSSVITIEVTAEDGQATQTYTVTVTRPASTDASLSTLAVQVDRYSPYSSGGGPVQDIGFDPGTFQYTASAGNGQSQATVTPTVNHSGANYVVKFGGAEDDDGEVSLIVGSNVITIEVTAEDENTTQTYTVTVTRLENNSPTGKPTISGTAEVGETLKGDASNIADADGINLTGVSNRTYEFSWWADLCDGHPGILGIKIVYADPTDPWLYTPEGEDFELSSYAAGYSVLLKVEYLDNGYVKERVWSDPTDIVPGPIESLTLVDTSDDSDVATLQCGIDSSEFDEIVLDANGSYTIRAELADDADVGSISWEVKRDLYSNFVARTDNGGSPYSLFGEDAEGNLLGRAFSAGVYGISLDAYSEADLGGDHLQKVWFIGFEAVLALSISGITTTSYAENGTSDVATYAVAGADTDSTITWSLAGDDSGDFSISSAGVLTFSSSPDYENAADADTDNVYEVTINASDGTNEGSLDVTVTVTDVNEGVMLSGG